MILIVVLDDDDLNNNVAVWLSLPLPVKILSLISIVVAAETLPK